MTLATGAAPSNTAWESTRGRSTASRSVPTTTASRSFFPQPTSSSSTGFVPISNVDHQPTALPNSNNNAARASTPTARMDALIEDGLQRLRRLSGSPSSGMVSYQRPTSTSLTRSRSAPGAALNEMVTVSAPRHHQCEVPTCCSKAAQDQDQAQNPKPRRGSADRVLSNLDANTLKSTQGSSAPPLVRPRPVSSITSSALKTPLPLTTTTSSSRPLYDCLACGGIIYDANNAMGGGGDEEALGRHASCTACSMRQNATTYEPIRSSSPVAGTRTSRCLSLPTPARPSTTTVRRSASPPTQRQVPPQDPRMAFATPNRPEQQTSSYNFFHTVYHAPYLIIPPSTSRRSSPGLATPPPSTGSAAVSARPIRSRTPPARSVSRPSAYATPRPTMVQEPPPDAIPKLPLVGEMEKATKLRRQLETEEFHMRQASMQVRKMLARIPPPEPDHMPQVYSSRSMGTSRPSDPGKNADGTAVDASTWNMLYVRGMRNITERRERLREAAKKREAQQLAEEAKICTFKPTVSELAHEVNVKGYKVIKRLVDIDQLRKDDTAEKLAALNEQRHNRVCTFRPQLSKRTIHTSIRANETTEQLSERLYTDAERYKSRHEKRLKQYRERDRLRIEKERSLIFSPPSKSASPGRTSFLRPEDNEEDEEGMPMPPRRSNSATPLRPGMSGNGLSGISPSLGNISRIDPAQASMDVEDTTNQSRNLALAALKAGGGNGRRTLEAHHDEDDNLSEEGAHNAPPHRRDEEDDIDDSEVQSSPDSSPQAGGTRPDEASSSKGKEPMVELPPRTQSNASSSMAGGLPELPPLNGGLPPFDLGAASSNSGLVNTIRGVGGGENGFRTSSASSLGSLPLPSPPPLPSTYALPPREDPARAPVFYM